MPDAGGDWNAAESADLLYVPGCRCTEFLHDPSENPAVQDTGYQVIRSI